MAAPKQPATITARKDGRVKKFRTTVWNLLPKEKNGWEQISGVVEIPVEAKKTVSAPVENKVSIETPPEAVKAEVKESPVALPPKTAAPVVAKAKGKQTRKKK